MNFEPCRLNCKPGFFYLAFKSLHLVYFGCILLKAKEDFSFLFKYFPLILFQPLPFTKNAVTVFRFTVCYSYKLGARLTARFLKPEKLNRAI